MECREQIIKEGASFIKIYKGEVVKWAKSVDSLHTINDSIYISHVRKGDLVVMLRSDGYAEYKTNSITPISIEEFTKFIDAEERKANISGYGYLASARRTIKRKRDEIRSPNPPHKITKFMIPVNILGSELHELSFHGKTIKFEVLPENGVECYVDSNKMIFPGFVIETVEGSIFHSMAIIKTLDPIDNSTDINGVLIIGYEVLKIGGNIPFSQCLGKNGECLVSIGENTITWHVDPGF